MSNLILSEAESTDVRAASRQADCPANATAAPLAAVVGADLRVPLVTGTDTRYVNLDYAASAPALQTVADQVSTLLPLYSSVHRGAGYASAVSTAAYEAARTQISSFVGARRDDVLIITRNTTDALNLLATAVPGPVVHLDIEHHANLLPWQARGGRVVTAGKSLTATIDAVRDELARQPAALLAVTGASNVTGECLPLRELAELAHRFGARLAVDGAQLVPHRRIDIAGLGVDYLAFSGHKLYAPFGAGVLVGRRDWLDAAPPYLAGGGAVRRVTVTETSWAPSPARHEAGTPNVVGAVALAAACRAIDALPDGAVSEHENALLHQLIDGLRRLDGVRILQLWPNEADRIGVVTFIVAGVPAELVAQYLSAEYGIGVRDGRFCAHPLLDRLNPASADSPTGTAVRASLGLGSASTDVDRLIEAVSALLRRGPAWTYAGAEDDYLPTPDPRAMPDWLDQDRVSGASSACSG
jgi:selenocysteine lyase/cysteine desulfurase